MKAPDLDRIRSEETHTLAGFMALYNENLPEAFPRATQASLEEYRDTHTEAFKIPNVWSLELHRKKLLDWLRIHPS